jgi:hypothetical protein
LAGTPGTQANIDQSNSAAESDEPDENGGLGLHEDGGSDAER